MKLGRDPLQPSSDPKVPTSIDRLPSEVQRSLRVFLIAAPTAELHRRRSALVRELVAHLVENGAAPST